MMDHQLLRCLQVLREAKRVVARLDKSEQQTQEAHALDPQRQELISLYSLGQKVTCSYSCSSLCLQWLVL